MKAGDEKVVGGKRLVWVICPSCDTGRWVGKSRVGMPNFTGGCMECYLKVAKQEHGRYYVHDLTTGHERGGNGYWF